MLIYMSVLLLSLPIYLSIYSFYLSTYSNYKDPRHQKQEQARHQGDRDLSGAADVEKVRQQGRSVRKFVCFKMIISLTQSLSLPFFLRVAEH